MNPQDKILYVANKLGLTSLKDMQATTRVVYDTIAAANGSGQYLLFENAVQRDLASTNLGSNGNQFEVNEALLIEKIGFYVPNSSAFPWDYTGIGENNLSVLFSLTIGNKTVLKDVSVETGNEQAFFGSGNAASSVIDLEGAGILIPPQVAFSMTCLVYNTSTRQVFAAPTATSGIGAYLFGTGVLLNFNTTI